MTNSLNSAADYTELGASADDECDGDLTSAIVIDASAVDPSTPGSYDVTYNVSDTAGNAATEVVRTVTVEVPTLPVVTLRGHNACANSVAWAPHSSCHVCTAGDDKQALIWDLSRMPKPVEEPILAYNAAAEINQLQWSKTQPDWIAIAFERKMQILRI